MFTRARIAVASVGTGLLLAGYVVGSTLGQVPAFAQVAAVVDTPAAEQIAQVPPQPSPKPGAGRRGDSRPNWGDPQQREQRRLQHQQMREQFITRLAANLGIDRDRVVQALRQTRIDRINQAVQDGKISRERADQIIQRINSGQPPAPRRPTNP